MSPLRPRASRYLWLTLPMFIACGPKKAPASVEVPAPACGEAVTSALATAEDRMSQGTEQATASLEGAVAKAEGLDRYCLATFLAELHRASGQSTEASKLFGEITASSIELPEDIQTYTNIGQMLLSNDPKVDFFAEKGLQSQRADILAGRALRLFEQDPEKAEATARTALQLAKPNPDQFMRLRGSLLKIIEPAPEASSPVLPASDTPLDAVRAAIAEGDMAAAKKALSRTKSLTGDEAEIADILSRSVEDGPPISSKIGVLLPLSGRFAVVGKQIQQALEGAWLSAGSPGQLLFKDSGATPETAEAAFDALVLEDDVLAVMGPLLSQELDALVSRADALGVPLISLSQSLDTAADHPWVVQAWLTPRHQVGALLDHTKTSLEMERFAIFAPESAYGQEAARVFEEEATARGLSVSISTFYDPKATDFIPFAQALGRKDYEARSAEFARLKKDAKEDGLDTSKTVLPPELDFDAIFMPESASRVPLVAAALAYEEFPIGTFRTSRTSIPMPLIGLSGWNKDSLIAQGGGYIINGLFTDVFMPPPSGSYKWLPRPEWKTFVDTYRASYDRTPSPLEAVAWDTSLWMAAVMDTRPDNRRMLMEAFESTSPPAGVTSMTGFDAQRDELIRQVRVFLVQKQGFVPVNNNE